MSKLRKSSHYFSGCDAYLFRCPGCDCVHVVTVNGGKNSMGATWRWNNSVDAPTFSPSILVTWDTAGTKKCHSYVTDGKIKFLGDSFHELKNQTVDIPEWEEAENADW
jgi:hypothetical protein